MPALDRAIRSHLDAGAPPLTAAAHASSELPAEVLAADLIDTFGPGPVSDALSYLIACRARDLAASRDFHRPVTGSPSRRGDHS